MTRNAAHLNALLAARDAKVYALRVMASAALAPQWTDDTTPRTEKPVRFVPFNGWSGLVRGDGGTFRTFRYVTFPR